MNWGRHDIKALLTRHLFLVSEMWSTVDFGSKDQSAFARDQMEAETRSGVRTLATLFLLPMLTAALFATQLGLDRVYGYGFLALAGLALHIHFSSGVVHEIEALHLLGMVLLVVSGTTFVLIAHKTGALDTVIFASVGLLFMAIPSMPWGLREASIALAMIYGLFTVSTWSVSDRFPLQTLWTLQLYMAAAAMISVTLVGRAALVRKRELSLRFDLERARGDLECLSYQDSLTGVWNRRHLQREFEAIAAAEERERDVVEFALVDLDSFKSLNDQYGHPYGDRVLCWVARALEVAIEEGGFVARIGGDEFVCILLGGSGLERMERAIACLAETVRAAGELDRFPPTFTTGLVRIPKGQDCDLETVYKAADNALYEGKRARGTNPSTSSSIVSLRLDATHAHRSD